ncbi:MAG: cobyrinic acid a,c-diamide synthase [Actinomycetota bacterium]
MSRRASLPGADELFRRTSSERDAPAHRESSPERNEDDKSTRLQVAESTAPEESVRRPPKHDEKITFYCTGEDLVALERARLRLRSEHGVAADRGRIVRAAVAYVLEDFEARGDDSVLLRKLST